MFIDVRQKQSYFYKGELRSIRIFMYIFVFKESPFCILRRPMYFRRADHMRKIQTWIQKTDVDKYSFTNRIIRDCNSFPATIFEPFPQNLSKFKSKLDS